MYRLTNPEGLALADLTWPDLE